MKLRSLKPISRASLGLLSLVMAGSALRAGEFTYSLPSASEVNWEDEGFWTNGDGVPYGPGIYPDAGDTIAGLNSQVSGQVTNLYLGGNRTVARLEGSELTGARLLSGSTGTANLQNSLTITEAFDVKAGAFYLRSQEGGRLTVTTPTLLVGSTEFETPDRIRVELGTTNAAHGNVSFTSQETVFQSYLSRFVLASAFDTAKGYVSLGHVTFDTNTGFNSGVTLTANTGGTNATIYVASLTSTAASTEGRFQGNGTVVIDPGTSTAAAPAVANFGRAISGGLRIEKEGDSLQIFSFDRPDSSTESNLYTGGTAINGGVLAVRNTQGSGLGTGAVSVASGGTLAGSGRIALGTGNAITVASGGVVAPGEDNRLLVAGGHEALTRQTLTLHRTALHMESGSSFAFRLSADGSSDRLAFTNYQNGSLILDGGEITINVSGDLQAGQTYTLFTFTDANGNAISSGLTGGLVTGDGFGESMVSFHYDNPLHGGIGTITMTVAPIPEPGAALLLLPVAAGALYWRGRRRGREATSNLI
ncbi:MAG TPA: hypothetical protein VNQ90_01360 [Chthoniobacteraceae bacterium]|nr:hypothetical protein [Chthoniobacteraceae bacterium]